MRLQLSIRQRITLGFILLIVLVLIAGGTGLIYSRSVDRTVDVGQRGIEHLRVVSDVQVGWLSVVATIDNMLLTRQTSLIDQRLAQEMAAFETQLAALRSATLAEDEANRAQAQRISDDLGELAQDLSGIVDNLTAATLQSQWARAQILRHTDLASVQRRFDAALENLATLIQDDVDQAVADTLRTQNRTQVFWGIIALVSVAFGVPASYLIIRSVVRPIAALVSVVQRVRAGDLATRAEVRGSDEISELATTFNYMASQLQATFGSLEARVAARTQDLFRTLQVGQLATQTLRQEELLPTITDYIREQFDLYYVQVYLLDDAGRYAVLHSGTGEVGAQLLANKHRLSLSEQRSIVARAARSGEPVLVQDTSTSDIHLPNPLLPDTRSEVAIPLIVGGQVLGVLDMQAVTPGQFNPDNLPVFEAMANQLASSLRSAQAYDEAQAAVARADAINRRLTREYWESYLGRIATAARVQVQYDLQDTRTVTPGQTGLLPPITTDNTLSQSINLRGQTIGQITVADEGGREWSAEDHELVRSVAERVALALEQFRAMDDTQNALAERIERENLLRSIIDTTPDWIYAKDLNFRYMLVNEAYARDFANRTPDEMIGHDDAELGIPTYLIEGDPERGIRGSRADDEAVLQSAETLNNPADYVEFADGTLHVLDTTKLPLTDASGRIIGLLGVSRDITEREQTRRRQQAAYELGQQLMLLLDEDALLRQTVTSLAESFGYYHVHVYLREGDEQLVVREGLGAAGEQLKRAGHTIPISAPRSLVARAARTLSPVVVNDVRDNPDHLPNPLLPFTRSEVALPLYLGSDLIGVLDVQQNRTDYFGEDEIRTLGTIASQLSVALSNARFFRELELEADRRTRLYELGQHLAESLDPADIAQAAVNGVADLLDVPEVSIIYHDAETDLLHVLGASGPIIQQMRGSTRPLNEIPDVERVIRTRTIEAEVDMMGEPTEENALARSLGFTASLLLPVLVADRVIGALTLNETRGPRAFSQDELNLVQSVALQVGIALQNAYQYQEQVEVAEQLRGVDRLKSEFLASMSHELRTPLNSIIGYAEVMLDGIDGELNDDMLEDVSAIHDSGRHLLNLINDILDLAKIEAGQLDIRSEAVDLRAMAQDVLTTSRVLLSGKPVELVLDVADGLPSVQADPLRLRQILSNLITNAIKFTEEGRVTVHAAPAADDPGMLVVSVSDTGIGISAENLPLVFERFRQVDQSATRRVGGTGLGLAITRQLVEMHGGEIWAESEVGRGSCFSFTIPVAVVPEAGD